MAMWIEQGSLYSKSMSLQLAYFEFNLEVMIVLYIALTIDDVCLYSYCLIQELSI